MDNGHLALVIFQFQFQFQSETPSNINFILWIQKQLHESDERIESASLDWNSHTCAALYEVSGISYALYDNNDDFQNNGVVYTVQWKFVRNFKFKFVWFLHSNLPKFENEEQDNENTYYIVEQSK